MPSAHLPTSITQNNTASALDARAREIGDRLQTTLTGERLSGALDLLGQLQEFELGRYLLVHGSLNGYWTRYCVVEHPKDRHRAGLHPLEDFLLNINSGFLATQERFTLFQAQTQKRLRSGMSLASVPCGYMDDLLGLDWRGLTDIRLTGIDVDPASCDAVPESAKRYDVGFPVSTYCLDAWETGKEFPAAFDLITSNGLNIYVADPEKERALYRSFYDALKKGGWLVTSIMTAPPYVSGQSLWLNVGADEMEKRKLIFGDILGAKWQHYHTPDSISDKLTDCGFSKVEIIYDSRRIHVTVVAFKS